MRAHFVRLARQTLVYGMGAVAQQLLGIVTLPIYSRVFAPTEYGALEVITVGLAVVSIVVDLGLVSASQRSYFDYTDDRAAERRVVLSSAIGPSFAIALVLGGILVLLHHPLSVWLFGSGRYGSAVIFAALSLPVTTLASFGREVMRLRFRPWPYLISSLIGAVAGTILAIVFVLAFHMGIKGVFAGALVGNLLALGYGLVVALPHIGRRVSRPELRIMLAYGLPLIPTALALWMLQFIDRLMLTKLTDLAQVGQYAVANRLSTVLLLVVSAFGVAYSPFMLALHSEDQEVERQVRGRLLTYVAALLVVMAVVLALFARELVSVVAPRFDRAYQAVGLVSAGMVALGVSQVAMSGIAIARRTRLFAIYTTVAAVVNIGLNFLLIPPWGQVGAAAATAVAYVLLAAIYYVAAQRLYPTPYQPAKIVALGALGAALMPIGLIGSNPLWLDVVAKAGALLVLLIGLWALRVLGPEELAEVRAALRRARGLAPVVV